MPDPVSQQVGPNKAIAAGLGGATVSIIVWLGGLAGLSIPGEVAGALTTLVSAGLAYFVPHGGSQI